MKILEAKYPKGTLPKQKTDGRYVDGYLYSNLEVLGKAIVKNNTFITVISSSTLEVGTGKSCFAQQVGEAWGNVMKKTHDIDLGFDINNIVFRPSKLIERSFEVPKYSCIILDEWEDAHYWSELGMTLRQFFRKCRQLNLFMILIIPNFFEMPKTYAISRSVAFIDVRFEDNFERGFFSFYGFKKKCTLYLEGKKKYNYGVVKPDFYGRFNDGYVVGEKIYLEAKRKDAEQTDLDKKKGTSEREIKIKLFKQLHQNLPKVSVKDLSNAFGLSRSTGFSWLKEDSKDIEGGVSCPV